jgi:hypothetical protein
MTTSRHCLVLDDEQFSAPLIRGTAVLPDGTRLHGPTNLGHYLTWQQVRHYATSLGYTVAQLGEAMHKVEADVTEGCAWKDAVKHAIGDALLEIAAERCARSPLRLDPR